MNTEEEKLDEEKKRFLLKQMKNGKSVAGIIRVKKVIFIGTNMTEILKSMKMLSNTTISN